MIPYPFGTVVLLLLLCLLTLTIARPLRGTVWHTACGIVCMGSFMGVAVLLVYIAACIQMRLLATPDSFFVDAALL